jgi:D-glycero-D-manno-heptose 1,7-bisphosphate phosphatase
MLIYALWQFPGVKLDDCWMVGDRPEDEQAAAVAGINFIWADIWRNRWK